MNGTPANSQFSAEQRAFQDSFRRFLGAEASSERLRQRIAQPMAVDRGMWQKLGAFGLFEYFSESGAGGGGIRDLALIAFECGYALFPEPLVETLLAGPLLCRLLGETAPAAIKSVADDVRAGRKRVVFACRPAREPVALVRGGSAAQFLLLLEHTQQGVGVPTERRALWSSVEGVMQPAEALDLSLAYAQAHVAPASVIELAPALAAELADYAALLAAMEVAGVAARSVQMTVEYVRTRRQFEVPVGGFQAVQHRLADMHLKAEALRALAEFAAWASDAAPAERSLAAQSAIVQACSDGAEIVEGAIQLHGGIGFTWEHDLHLLLRRAKMIEILYRSLYPPEDLIGLCR